MGEGRRLVVYGERSSRTCSLTIDSRQHTHILDATRISDGKPVVLKKLSKAVHPYEAEISAFFSAEPLASHPRNHCVPTYEILDIPDEEDTILLVLPLLRPYDNPVFVTVGETVDFFAQIFQVLRGSCSATFVLD